MGKPNFSDEFKRDAVVQITARGYPVAEVWLRLGVSPHSLYAWKRQFAKVVSGDTSKDAEIRQLRRDLARVTEERDILKNCHGLSPPVCDRNESCYGAAGGSRPIAYWWQDTPLKNVARGHLRT